MGGDPWDRATALETRATEDGGNNSDSTYPLPLLLRLL